MKLKLIATGSCTETERKIHHKLGSIDTLETKSRSHSHDAITGETFPERGYL